jgi:hypothetical protein
MQKLLKILIQKLPMDKNGDLIFDIDEARDIHNNAVEMLRRAVGVDVLTTFAEIDAVDMSDKNTSTTVDDLEKNERAVFNSLGISQNLFNTNGNLSLEKSILNDESSVRNLLLQFGIFFNRVTRAKSTNSKKYFFKLSPFSKISTIVIVCCLKTALMKGGLNKKYFFKCDSFFGIFHYSNYTTPKILSRGVREKYFFEQPPTTKFLNIIMLLFRERKVSFEEK